ncbi:MULTISPECIES: 4-hydroxythreonine-4-phosphate dehydrogenase [unclassified Ensifer]|uniref:4-hydroxythreonine-4-phosphate dehydrogenase n=1 Tax=unclassified Ensifer TaxID=2633371 RepID=UPI000813A2B8|nr:MULTISPECIES: 4-hydroxythreonine-4-phosphate dehydrogenase [unclassified Ensifer]OCP15817.1 4-hydroxythreonine-4-phosphate dehydrogenase [Ensifer sp. LC54]OCP26164.1 4-hydroxythreonine-4-phosphate dehydrogenase [Ensifer sp. LC384]
MSEPDFIFMLTRNDRTVSDAAIHLQTALAAGVRHIGFKDIGLPFGELAALNRTIKESGALSYLEVVSLDRDSEIASVRAAIKLDVDHLLGGTHVADVLPLIEGTGIRYSPFPGRITGHPSILEGSIEDITASAIDLAGHDGVHGLDLLAYRAETDVPALIRAVCGAVQKPVIVAGSIDRAARIQATIDNGAAGFTVGTAALDGAFPASLPGLTQQLLEIRALMTKTA